MPRTASIDDVAVQETRRGRYSVLSIDLPDHGSLAAGILLEDPSTDRLYIRLRRDWAQIAPEEAEVLSLVEQDWGAQAAQLGAAGFFDQKEDTLSNAIQVSDRRETIVEDFERALARLYREHVASQVQEFITHLPRYSLTAAAGPFRENREIEAEGWVETPARLRLTSDMFVARITGRSMEPVIPDGSLCIFRRGVEGSRQGRLLLVEARGSAAGTDDRYTVKRYRSAKTSGPADSWAHESITLESLNPEFPSWDLDPEEDRYQILAEFVQLLD